MNLLVKAMGWGLVLLVTSCGLAEHSSELTSDTKYSFLGCHDIKDYTGPESPLAEANRLCVEDTLKADGAVSRSGRFSFVFFDIETTVQKLGADLSASQPRCPDCYTFQGMFLKVEWLKNSQGISVTFNHRREEFRLSL